MAAPKPRSPGQTGGGNHWRSQASSRARGGSPRAKGGGGKPPKKGGSGSIFLAPWIDIPMTLAVASTVVWKALEG